MSESQKPLPSVTDSPWFWVMLFSLAGLAALFTIGPKFERREASIEEKFHARERGLGREAVEQPTDDAATASAAHDDAGQSLPWQPIFTITPIALVLTAIAMIAMWNVMRIHQRRLQDLRRSASATDH